MKANKTTIDINKLCLRCLNACKQSEQVLLLHCPRYEYKPEQLEIKFPAKRNKKKLEES